MKKIIEWLKRDRNAALTILVAFFAAWVIGFTLHIIDRVEEKTTINRYADQCTEQKGIAVRDLEGKMRCVPMFAALKGKP